MLRLKIGDSQSLSVPAASRAAPNTRSMGAAPWWYSSPTFVSDTTGVTVSAWIVIKPLASSHSTAMLN